MPGSPATQTIARLPLHAMSQARRSRDSGSARPMKWGTSATATRETFGRTPGAAGIALGGAMKRYPRRDTVSMKRGLRASSSSAVRSSLIAVLNTESVTNWWPQTSSSKAFVVSRDPGCRARAHRTANGVGARVTAVPSRSRRAFASSSSNRSKRTRTGSNWPKIGRGRCVQPFRYERIPRPSRYDNGVNPLVGSGVLCAAARRRNNDLSTEWPQ